MPDTTEGEQLRLAINPAKLSRRPHGSGVASDKGGYYSGAFLSGACEMMPVSKPEIVLTYCTQCQWLLRAAWLAQELLSTFADRLAYPIRDGIQIGRAHV